MGLRFGWRRTARGWSTADDLQLVADCARCAALCCVAPPFSPSADFAISKPAGRPCPNLLAELHCGIHDELRPSGFSGCSNFDCFGAGQRVTEATPAGRDWRASRAAAAAMFQAYFAGLQLHRLLWHIGAALRLVPDPTLAMDLLRARHAVAQLAPQQATAADIDRLRTEVNELLLTLSAAVRVPSGPSHRGADRVGAKLRGADLRAADLFGACFVGADLRDADLRGADLRGTDLRGADLRGADLSQALFMTRAQASSALGDQTTVLPAPLEHPAHWCDQAADDAPPE